jgi:hypothetical protein
MSIKEILEQVPKLTPEERQELRDWLGADEFPETDDMSNHLCFEIPLRAYLNAGIIDRVVGTPAFEEAAREVMTLVGYGSYKYDFKNPAYVLGMLYGLVVVPFEHNFSDPGHPVYEQLRSYKGGVASLFKIDISPQENHADTTYWLIKRLRNSISHVRFSISLPKQDFCFWDQRPRAAEPYWRCRITNEHLFVFLNALGQILAPNVLKEVLR